MAGSDAQVDLETRKILADLRAVVDSLDVPMLLIGARARILMFDSQYGQGRATRDWDLAVKVDNWSRYETLVTQMTASKTARFRKTNVVHKFIHLGTGLEVDIIPFGDISGNRQEITWLDGARMSVLGLQEAFSNARIEKVEEIEIRVLGYPALVGLKILAWHERGEDKDLADLVHVLRNYEDDERVIEELYTEIQASKLEFEIAAPALLGRDIQAIFQDRTLEKIREILLRLIEQQNRYFPQFISKISDRDDWDEEFEQLVSRFQALQYGINHLLSS